MLLNTKSERPRDLAEYTCIEDLEAEPMDPERFEGGQEHETVIMCYSSGTVSLYFRIVATH